MNMKTIDLNTWDRLTHYRFFKTMAYSQYNISLNLDITNFLPMVRGKQLSFYCAMIFAATHELNKVEAFRYRIRGEQVVLHDTTHPSFTALPKGSELFKIVTVEMEDSLESFAVKAEKRAEEQTCFILDSVEERDDLFYITCIPWISFMHLSHPISLDKDDSTPRVSWGKYYSDGEKIMLPFSVQAHHSLVDGIHMGKYVDGLQDFLNTFR